MLYRYIQSDCQDAQSSIILFFLEPSLVFHSHL